MYVSKNPQHFAVISEEEDEDYKDEPLSMKELSKNHKTVASPHPNEERLQSISNSYTIYKKNIKELSNGDGLGTLGSNRQVKFKKSKKRPKSAITIKQRKIEKQISISNQSRFQTPQSIFLEKGVRDYTSFEKFFMKTTYQMLQLIGESEMHIESLRQKLAKCQTFESYDLFRKIGGKDSMKSQMGISHKEIYKYICNNSDLDFSNKIKEEEVIYLVNFHSHNKDGYLSFTDFNQMVLPTCNLKLRAEATQRLNIFQNCPNDVDTKPAEQRLIQLLVAEICLNLDLEIIKNRLESAEVKASEISPQGPSTFKTELVFELIDVRNYRYLDMEGFKAFMETYFNTMMTRHNGFDPLSVNGTGFALDLRPKFFKALMRRLGLDMTKKIDYREFARILKPSSTENLVRAFGQNFKLNREKLVSAQRSMLEKSIRDAQKGPTIGAGVLGPMKAFQSIMIHHKTPALNSETENFDPSLGPVTLDNIESCVKKSDLENTQKSDLEKRGNIQQFMLEISGKKTVEETAKKENGKIVEPYKRRREDNSGRDMRFNFPIQRLNFGEDPSPSRSRSRSKSKGKVQFSEYESQDQIDETLIKGGVIQRPPEAKKVLRARQSIEAAPVNFNCLKSVRRYDLLLNDMRNNYNTGVGPNFQNVSNILGVEGIIQDAGVQKLSVPDRHLMQMQKQKEETQKQYHYQNQKFLEFRHPKNTEFVKQIKRSRSRSENERRKMETTTHRTDMNQFIRKFQSTYIKK